MQHKDLDDQFMVVELVGSAGPGEIKVLFPIWTTSKKN
jgi:hypothetical protein